MGSADWMPRNLDRRVEICFPVEKEELREDLRHFLEIELADNVKASVLQSNGDYVRPERRGRRLIDSQTVFEEEARLLAKQRKDIISDRVFVPEMKLDEDETSSNI